MKVVIRRFILSILWRAVRIRVAHDNPYVIAVTGSVGKTSTKEAIATLLERTGKPVVKTQANMATDTGIPLSLLGFADRAKTRGRWVSVLKRALIANFPTFSERPYYVLELSSDTPGDLAFLAKHFPIHIAVFTTGGPVHLELYKSEQAVVDEIATLLQFVQPDGLLITNADDSALRGITSSVRTQTYGITSKTRVDLRGSIAKRTREGLLCAIEWGQPKKSLDSVPSRRSENLTFTAAIWGEHQMYPLLAAALVGLHEGMKGDVLKQGLEAYQLPAGRGRIISGHRSVTVIDDTANSSPEAVDAGVAMLKPYAGKRRTVAILGTMNELGEFSENAHRAIAANAAGKVDYLVALGQFAPVMQQAAQKAGMHKESIISYLKPEQLMSQLSQVVQKDDVVYLKASQNGMRLERIVKQLMQHPESAAELLVRQGNEWKE